MTKERAQAYIDRGFPIIPVPWGQKSPVIKDWPNLVIGNDNLDDYFTDAPQNMAILLGKEGSNIVDLDLDCMDAVFFAQRFAPKTGFFYGRASNPNSHHLYSVKDGEDKPVKFDAGDGKVYLEIRSKGQATILPGSQHPSGEIYGAGQEESPLEISFAALYRSAALVAVCCIMVDHWPKQGGRQNAALHLAGLLCKAGYSKEEVISAIYHIAQRAGDEEATQRRMAAEDTIKKFSEGVPVAGISRLKESLPQEAVDRLAKWLDLSADSEIEEAVEDINKKHAFIIVGGGQRILNFKEAGQTDGKRISFMKVDAFKNLYRNQRVCVGVGKNGQPNFKSIAEIWLEHPDRLTYRDMVFEPGADAPPDVFNYWQGYAIAPAEDETGCRLFLEHLHEIVCARDESSFMWMLGWLAQMVQKPGEKPGTAIVLIGPQGSGKSITAEYVGKLFGSHYLKLENPKHFVGNFNAHQDGVVFLLCEEVFAANDKKTQSLMKDKITSEKMLIERKGVDPIVAKNCLHILMTSNEGWAISADTDDRRYFVLEVSGKVAKDEAYFSRLHEEMKNGGPSALLRFLLDHDFSGINLRRPPQTQALIEQKLMSLDGIGKMVHKFLTRGYIHPKGEAWPAWIETEQFCEICFAGAKKLGELDKGLQTKLGMTLPKYLGEIKKEKKVLPEADAETGIVYPISVGGVNKKQQTVYILPPLDECRKRFTEKTGIPISEVGKEAV